MPHLERRFRSLNGGEEGGIGVNDTEIGGRPGCVEKAEITGAGFSKS